MSTTRRHVKPDVTVIIGMRTDKVTQTDECEYHHVLVRPDSDIQEEETQQAFASRCSVELDEWRS